MGRALNAQGKRWSAADIPSLAGQRALVTGANSGIGFHAALELARHGAHVVLGCRDGSKGEAAAQRIRRQIPGVSLEVLQLDLASLRSVREAAETERAQGKGLDLLINNAGVMAPKKRKPTEDGFELQFGTNVLGHFALTALLMPALELAAGFQVERPRVVTIASIAHKRGRLDFADLQSEQSYKPMVAYAQTKLANVMFALEFERRLQAAGEPASRVMSVAAHPGVAHTNLFQVGDYSPIERRLRGWIGVLIGTFLNTEQEGTLPTLYAATAAEANPGGYYGPQGWLEMRGGDVGEAVVAPQARDTAAAQRLWAECQRLTGVKLL